MVDPADSLNERLRGRLKWFLFFRVLAASGFLGALALLYLRSGESRYAVSVSLLLHAIIVTYALTIASAVFLLRLRRLTVYTYLQLVFDVALMTGVVFVTGGADSPFGFLYSLVVINGAILLSTPGAITVAAISSIGYAGLVALLGSGLVARPDYPFPPAPPDLQFALRFTTNNATFFVIALLASSLVRRLHQAERLLEVREAEHDRLVALHEALARNIGSALFTTDTEGCVTSLNHTAEEVAGLDAEDIKGKDIGTTFAPLRHSAGGRLQFQQSSSVHPTEFTHRTRDGRELVLRCSVATLRDTYNNLIGALYILQDITALRRLEQRVHDESLESVLAEETDADDAPLTDGLTGHSPEIQRVRALIERISKTDATLLIAGESGTGKELVARAVHARSARRDRPFVAVNCGAIPENLIETELFGHVRGAYTGAVASRAGLFRTADGGTIFLDEIGDLPLLLQVKLLRVLQERSFTPIGADAHVTVDVRVIAATNRQLADEVGAGRFREDLWYRLNVLTIDLPPLRERRQDIPILTRRFLRQFSEAHGKLVPRLSVAAARRLQDYEYPGNVRELENIIEHAVALCEGEAIHESHLPEYVLKPQRTSRSAAPVIEDHPTLGTTNLDEDLAAHERAILLRALAEAGGVKKRAAGLLGINYRSFRHRLHKYGLTDASVDEPTS